MANQKLIGIQVGVISFLDEGLEPVLDLFQEKVGINALFLANMTFTLGTGGRSAGPLPDHGVQERTDHFRGGAFFQPHPPHYQGLPIGDFRAPDPEYRRDVDYTAWVLEAAIRRGLAVFHWFEPAVPRAMQWVPGLARLGEVDCYGRRRPTVCINHPDFRAWTFAIVEDLLMNYPAAAGLMYGSERRGPLGLALQGQIPFCFCEHCCALARERGIDPERARQGYRALWEYLQTLRQGTVPRDGAMVGFLRLLMRYPEIVSWEALWAERHQRLHQEIYGLAKAVTPDKRIGWHVWHHLSFSPLLRAQWDYQEIRRYADFLKPVVYNNCAGPRFHTYLRNLHETILHDSTPQKTCPVMYDFLQLAERPYDEIYTAGWSGDYVRRETLRCLEGVNREIPVWPGIDLDIPTPPDAKKTTPEDVRAAIRGAAAAGADGVILSRKYSEMQTANLLAAGEALREVGWR